MQLIINQEQFERNQRKEISKEKIRIVKEKGKQKISNIIFITICALVMLWGLTLLGNMKNHAYNNCIENGYSMNYCLKNS